MQGRQVDSHTLYVTEEKDLLLVKIELETRCVKLTNLHPESEWTDEFKINVNLALSFSSFSERMYIIISQIINKYYIVIVLSSSVSTSSCSAWDTCPPHTHLGIF